MAPQVDPYRTLGLARGASLAEVKGAYRRLAKANHPDRAGEGALPRFLAIQAAYDQIAGPDGGRRSRPGSSATGGTQRRPWDAEPDRADATYRAYGGRPRRARPATGPRPRSTPGGGPAQTGSPPGAGRSRRPERPPNKATLGSTSYDGAEADPFEPDWAGASWYGTTSGTYWTLNPKEYADPRKHGPEYQARATRHRSGRRAAPASDPTGSPESPGTSEIPGAPPMPEPDERPGAPGSPDAYETAERTASPTSPDAAGRGSAPPTHTTASWWATTAGDPLPGSAHRTRPVPPPLRAAQASQDAPPVMPSADAVVASTRAWLDDDRPGAVSRVGRAVAGWAPIALGVGWGAGEITGCGRFSADCDPAVAPASWLAQIAVLGLLLLVPRLARIATIATLATLAAVVPGAVLLLATSDPSAMEAGRSALGGLMIIAWVAGIAIGIGRETRSVLGPRPVS